MVKVVLNIANNYFGSMLYNNILSAQNQIGITPKVISFLSHSECQNQQIPSNCLLLGEPRILNILFKLFPIVRFYYHKKAIVSFMKDDQILWVHSHTVHSNGSLGYLIATHYGCKHIISVRNTDINYSFKYFLHLHWLYKKIIKAAYKVTAPNLPYAKIIERKFVRSPKFLPNPIDHFWEQSLPLKTSSVCSKSLKVCTLGAINRNKNQLSVIKALANFDCTVSYTVIGNIEDAKYFQLLVNEATKRSVHLTHINHINEKDVLLDLIRKSDIMCLTSYKETFGLAYIESAMAGVAVVYSKSQGIDGILDEGNIGYSATPNSIKQIYKAIDKARKLNPSAVSSLATDRFGYQNYLKTLRGLYD